MKFTRIPVSWVLLCVWLTCFLSSSASPVTFHYDGSNHRLIAYDGDFSPASVYDAGLVRTESEMVLPSNRQYFIVFATFLAAEGLPQTGAGSFLGSAEGRLFRSAVSGESMDAGLFSRVQGAFQRTPGRFMFSDANSEAFLGPDLLREGETLSQNVIMLRQAPSTSSVYEELIHTAQLHRGMSPENGGWFDMEIEAQQKLIRNADLYGIPAADTAATAARLRYFQSLPR